ncbi:TetR family transcriptional regulator [Mycobacterium dioxanotrophicus]|uniref:TetR family transcriptional regulator n=3 Tax=Mycobacteriaceae TaxID=1762 RepID=A0A1Y0BWW8_9MYCO|nr:TetR family transcriptional regulator [Mycobacterium dioxanotrophicus]ORA31165.1 TetR family transcriptional regulator [Mycobacterium aquaticum]
MSAMTKRGRPGGQARRRLLDAAARRFYADGIAATGIDVVTADAGVAKMSLYNNFASKAELVASYLEERHAEWLGLYARRRAHAVTAEDKVLAVFDAYADHAEMGYEHGFRGCGLLNAAAELPVGDPGRDAVRRHKEEVEQILRSELVAICGEHAADGVAEHMSFLLEGSIARAGLEGRSDRIAHARALAAALMAAL